MGYDTGLKNRIFKVGDKVIRMHEPLKNLKLTTNWDGPHVITRVISECTVVIRSPIGRLYKSNVARLRPWRGREMSTEMAGQGLQDLISNDRIRIVKPDSPPKRGRGWPRKVVKRVSKPKVVNTVTKCANKVSPGEGRKGRKVKVVTTPDPINVPNKAGSKREPEEGVRRSSRLRERAAVT